MKLTKKIVIMLSMFIFLLSISVQAYEKDVISVDNIEELSEHFIKKVGKMELPEIDPVSNPAENNWLSKKIAYMVFGDENQFDKLTQEHFDSITEINYICLDYIGNIPEGFIPIQIGNLVNLEKISINSGLFKDIDLSLPTEIKNLENLTELTIRGFNFNEESLKEISYLSNLTYLCLGDNKLKEFPNTIFDLNKLESLNLFSNYLTSIPEEISRLTSLKYIDLSGNSIFEFDENLFENLLNLKSVYMQDQCILQPIMDTNGSELQVGNIVRYNDILVEDLSYHGYALYDEDDEGNEISWYNINKEDKEVKYEFNENRIMGNNNIEICFTGIVIQPINFVESSNRNIFVFNSDEYSDNEEFY